MSEKLRPVKNDIQTILWCGPAVISAVTGEPVSGIVSIAKQLSGGNRIKGVSTGLLQRTLAMLGWEAIMIRKFDFQEAPVQTERLSSSITITTGGVQEWVETKKRPTLAAYTRKYRADFQEHACIIELSTHWVAVYGRRFVDNHTKEPVFLRKSPHRRARVQRVLQIRKLGGPDWKPRRSA